jgi:hypothetical protein
MYKLIWQLYACGNRQMGSKTPPPGTRLSAGPVNGTDQDLTQFGLTATRSRLRRVADALQVPEAMLYNPADTVAPMRNADSDSPNRTDLDQERVALLRAYASISDPEERSRILTLVQEAAERL